MFEILFGVLEQGLKLWNTKESSKYFDRLLRLKKAWYEEYNKPSNERDHNALDSIEYELRILSESFIAASRIKDVVD